MPRTYNWQLRVTERRTLLLIGDLTIALASLGISLFYWVPANGSWVSQPSFCRSGFQAGSIFSH